jgi:hypothetical protein
MDHLAILSQTIADHARKTAHQEWDAEHGPLWHQIIHNAGLSKSTLDVDGRSIPIEVITKALREQFLKHRVAQLLPQLTHSVVETAFKKVITDKEDTL